MGMEYSVSGSDPGRTLELLVENIENNPKLKSLATYEDQDLKIGIHFFGNPKVGTPLMQINPRVALDLPQRMLSYTDGSNGSILVYNSGDYLAKAYGLKGAESIDMINKALSGINASVTGDEVRSTKGANFGTNKGVGRISSNKNFRESYQLVLEGISQNGYKAFKEIDHGENARNNGFELPNTRLLMVEDPELSQLVDKTDHSLFLDVYPLKFLVWDDGNGKITVSFHRLEFHFARRKLNTNSRGFIELKRMQSGILEGVKKGRDALPSKDLPS